MSNEEIALRIAEAILKTTSFEESRTNHHMLGADIALISCKMAKIILKEMEVK
jgi:hypothetical protein